MAIVTLQGGWAEGLLKHWVEANFTYLVTLGAGDITASNIESVIGKAQTEFRYVCNKNFTNINSEITVANLQTLHASDNWEAMRDKLNTNFGLAAAALTAAHSASSSPSATPSTSPSEGTPSDTPSASPSEGTPSDTPSGSPSEGTPSSSPSGA